MPIYTSRGKTYNIPDDRVKDFLTKRDDAQEVEDTSPKDNAKEIATPRETNIQNNKGIDLLESKTNEGKTANVEEETLKGFIPNVKQNTEQIKTGVQYSVGEGGNLFTGSSKDAQKALDILEKHHGPVYDPQKAYYKDLEDKTEREWNKYEKDLETWKKDKNSLQQFVGLLPFVGDAPEKPKDYMDDGADLLNPDWSGMLGEVASYRPYNLVAEALAKGDVEQAKAFLRDKAQHQSWGDGLMDEAVKKMATFKKTEGFAGWVGSLIPQMIPNVLAIVASLHPSTRGFSKPLGAAGMGVLTASASGQAMADARVYAEEKGIDVSDADVFKAGGIAGAIEFGTELIPFGRYMSRIGGAVQKKAIKEVVENIIDNPEARKEANNLFKQASKSFTGKITKENVKTYGKDIVAEGASEFAAESLGTLVPMIYQHPEDYPTLSEVLLNGIEGAKAGMFMGGVLGGGSMYVNNAAQNQRRKQQGSVAFARTGDEVVEVIGRKNDSFVVLDEHGTVKDIPINNIEDTKVVEWDVFNKFASDLRKENIADNVFANLEASEKRIIKENFNESSKNFDKQFAGTDFFNLKPVLETATLEEQQEFIIDVMADESIKDEAKGIALDYITKLNAYNSYTQAKEAIIDDAIQDAEAVVDEHINPKMNAIVTAKVNGVQDGVYVIDGTIETFEDGSINKEKSDKEIFYKDAEGNVRVTSPEFLRDISVDGREDVMQQTADHVAETIGNQQLNEEVREYTPGETVSIDMRGDGMYLQGQIQEITPDGNYIVLEAQTGNAIEVEPRSIVNLDHLQGIDNGSIVTYLNAQGEVVQGEVTDFYSMQSSGMVGIGNDIVPIVNIESLANEVVEDTNSISESEVPAVLESNNSGIETEQSVTDYPSEQNKIRLESISKDEKGNTMFESVPVQHTIEALSEVYEDAKELSAVVDATIGNIEKQIEKTKIYKPTGDINKDISNKQKTKQELTSLASKLAYWNDVRGTIHEIRPDKEQITEQLTGKGVAEVPTNPVENRKEDKVKKNIPKKATPFRRRLATVEENIHTVRDRILFGIASGAYKFRWKDKGVSVGLGREMGLSGSEAERKSRIGLLRNDGYTPSSLAHHIWEETGRELNDNDIRSEVIDVLYSVTSKRQALEELETTIGLNEDAYYQEQAEAHQFEEEQRAQVEARYNEIQDQLNEEILVSLRDKALSLGATLKQLQDVQIDTDYIDLIEQLEDGRRQTSDSTGNNEQIEVDNGEENNDQRTQRAVGEGDRSEENTGYSRQDSYSRGDRISLSPEEQRVVNEATEQIDAEIAEIESSIRGKQTELQNKRKELGKEYAKENQTDLFPTEKTSDNLFDVDADFSKKNIESIIKPIENELSSLLNKGRDLMNSKSKRVNDALDNHRKQGNLLDEISRAEAETDTNPSEAQKEAGNYKKGKVNIQGLDISIEQAKGSTRSGVDADGKAWSVMMNNTYGYIRGTEGKDGDHIDVFIGDNPESTRIYVVDQMNKEGRFDEHKVMLGFESEASAKEAYLSNYEAGWQGLGNITEVGIEDFTNWAKSDTRRIKPFAEYKSVQASMEETRLQDGDAWNIGDINDTFNEQLKEQIAGALPKGYVYNLGHPSDVLQSAGIPDLPIELASARLYHKSNQENHPFELSEITDLPIAVQNPLAVFRSATHLGSNVILTELRQGGKNFVVAIDTNRKQGRIEVNSIRSIHPRTANNIANWINEGLMDYGDKEKLSDWLKEKIKSRSYLNSSNPADVKKLLDSATKIVNEFENPKLQRLNNRFRSIDASKAGKLIDVLKKTGLAKDVVTDTALYDAKLRELGYDVREHRIDRSGNYIGDGSYNIEPSVFDFSKEYPYIESKVNYSSTTESTYVKYTNTKNDKSVTVRFSEHENNAVKFGDQLDGNFVSKDEILYRLGLKQRKFIPNTYLSIHKRAVSKKDMAKGIYEVADKTIQEMYAMGEHADLSAYTGKLAKNSNYLILGDKVNLEEDRGRNVFGNTVTIGAYVYEALEDTGTGSRMQVLWHGSPHAFNKFSTDYMGSGEGVQAYGWGLYFTDRKGIAETYAKSNEPEWSQENRTINKIAQNQLESSKGDKPDAISYLSSLLNEDWSDKKRIKKAIKILETGKELKVSGSNLYEVKIHGDKNVNDLNFIRWDKEITKSQLENIENVIKEGYPDFDWENTGLDFIDMTEATGKEIYKALSNYMEDFTDSPQQASKEASMILLKAGIDGIQYPSEYRSKGTHEDSYNYVIFEGKTIEITDRIRLMSTPKGDVYGFVTSDNVVYLDLRRMNANTPIHEFGHLWNSFTKENNTVLWTKGEELIMQSPYYWEKVNQNPAYSHLSKGAKIDEALAMAIGDKGEAFVNRTMKERFVDWMAEMWKFIKQKLGVSDQLDIANMTLNNFTDKAVKDLLGGKRLVDAADSTMTEDSKDVYDENVRLQLEENADVEAFRNELDKKLLSKLIKVREAYGDQHLAVKEFQELLEKNGTKIDEHNDYYLRATHVYGKIQAQLESFEKRFYQPMTKAIGSLEKQGLSYRDIENYVLLKHGLERNATMRKEAIESYKEKYPDASEAQINTFTEKVSSKDYSGLEVIEEEVEKHAEWFINDFEEQAGKELIDNLWDTIRKSTEYSLQKLLEGGQMSKQQLIDLKARGWEYYVPMRGHDKQTAEERWDYSPNAGTYFSNPMKTANGRSTRAEFPFSYIHQMAQSAINASVKNQLNQTILRLGRKDKTLLLSVNKVWYEKVGTEDGKDVYEVRTPEWSDNAEQYQDNLDSFEAKMEELKSLGMAFEGGKKRVDIGKMFIKPSQAAQHDIRVFENGIEYVVHVNANPKVAQAINGTNMKTNEDLKLLAKAGRWMAANFTTRNPMFVVRNFLRDYLFASSILGVKENAQYALQFQQNIPKSTGALQRYLRGVADMSKKQDQYMMEYIMNGAKTGFSHLIDIRDRQKRLEKDLKKRGEKGAIRTLTDFLQGTNDFAENLSRLSVYITSREQGRSITQSVSDAKEVTVNFNRRGTGAMGAKHFRALYLFVNAGIQAASNITNVSIKNPKKATALYAGYVSIGVITPLLIWLLGGDDAEEEYFKQSDWDRQNNLCIYTGNGFTKIPLPQELRVFHRMGDNIYRSMQGRMSIADALLDTALGMTDLIPLNPMGAVRGLDDGVSSDLKTVAKSVVGHFSPDVSKPFIQLLINQSFTGSKITKENVKKHIPGYKRVRTNKKGEPFTPSWLIALLQGLDNVTGGDGVERGTLSLNPDEVNHLIGGYFGGNYTMASQLLDLVYKGVKFADTGDFEWKVRETPLRSFYTSSDDLSPYDPYVNKEYYNIQRELDEIGYKYREYANQAMRGKIDQVSYDNKIDAMQNEIDKWSEIKAYTKLINRLEKLLPEAKEEEQNEIEDKIYELKRAAILINKEYETGKHKAGK